MKGLIGRKRCANGFCGFPEESRNFRFNLLFDSVRKFHTCV